MTEPTKKTVTPQHCVCGSWLPVPLDGAKTRQCRKCGQTHEVAEPYELTDSDGFAGLRERQ